ncbi:MAG: hypothetical protein ACXWUH_02205 [Burkholderiales bacterium]
MESDTPLAQQLRRVFDQRGAWPDALLFVGVVLTAFGSAWYRAQPNDATLLWDRLPLALGFARLGRRHLDGSRAAADCAVAARVCNRRCRQRALLARHRESRSLLVMQAGFMVATLIATAYIPTCYTHANRIYSATGLRSH